MPEQDTCPTTAIKSPQIKDGCLLRQMEMAKRVDSGVEKRIKRPSISRKRRRRRRHNGSVLKKFVDYLKSDSYMFAPLLSRYPSDFLQSNAVLSSSAAGVEFTEKGKRVKKSLVEQVGDYLNSDSHLYAPLLAPHRRMGIASKKSAEEDMEGSVEKVGNAGDHIIRQQHKETIVKHMVCRSVSASGKCMNVL